jgi:hypothetical protein
VQHKECEDIKAPDISTNVTVGCVCGCYTLSQVNCGTNSPNVTALKSMCCAYFHSTVQYGIIFCGNSSNSRKIFTLRKKIIRSTVGAHPRTPCGSLFKEPEILPVPCQYISSLMNCFVNNQENFQTNPPVHTINTRNEHRLHRPIASLSCFQNSAFYSSIRIFNSLPTEQCHKCYE